MQLFRLLFIGVTSIVLVCLVFWHSLMDYFIRTYHIDFGLKNYSPSFFAKELDSIREVFFDREYKSENLAHNASVSSNSNHANDMDKAQTIHSKTQVLEHTENQNIITDNNSLYNQDNNFQLESYKDFKDLHSEQFLNDSRLQDNNSNISLSGIRFNDGKLFIDKDMEFLLIGDSLMQGIGASLVKQLGKKGLRVLNMAKQSTGLTYTHSFDWAKETKKAIDKNQNISVLVVCLGANDPWDLDQVKFGTKEWDKMYTSRIDEILSIAKVNDIFVVWFEVPIVRDRKLNKKISHLNDMYKERLHGNGLFLTTESITDNGKFSSYIKDSNGRGMLVRAQDGIHLSTNGYKMLSQLLIQRLVIEENHYFKKL